MKQIRFNVFETNSSSTHSLVFVFTKDDLKNIDNKLDVNLFEVFDHLPLCDAFVLNKVYTRDEVLEMFQMGKFPTIDDCNEISIPRDTIPVDPEDETDEYYDEYCHANDWWNHIPNFEVIKVSHKNIIVRTSNNNYLLSYYETDGETDVMSELRIVSESDTKRMIEELNKTLQ